MAVSLKREEDKRRRRRSDPDIGDSITGGI